MDELLINVMAAIAAAGAANAIGAAVYSFRRRKRSAQKSSEIISVRVNNSTLEIDLPDGHLSPESVARILAELEARSPNSKDAQVRVSEAPRDGT